MEYQKEDINSALEATQFFSFFLLQEYRSYGSEQNLIDYLFTTDQLMRLYIHRGDNQKANEYSPPLADAGIRGTKPPSFST